MAGAGSAGRQVGQTRILRATAADRARRVGRTQHVHDEANRLQLHELRLG